MTQVATAPAMAPLIAAVPMPPPLRLVRRDIRASLSSHSVADNLGASEGRSSDSAHRAGWSTGVVYSLQSTSEGGISGSPNDWRKPNGRAPHNGRKEHTQRQAA